MMGLTKRQSEALAFIRGFIEAKGYSPSYREIAAGIDTPSTGEAHRLVHQLIERGAHVTGEGRARSLALPRAAA